MASEQRPVEQVRCVAECRTCHQTRAGVTTVQQCRHGDHGPGYRWHVCDGCVAARPERPVDVVLLEYLGA